MHLQGPDQLAVTDLVNSAVGHQANEGCAVQVISSPETEVHAPGSSSK